MTHNSEKWSESAWQKVGPVYRAILQLPFVRELAEGTLARDRFMYYIAQDSLYIDNYSRVLAHIASRLPQKTQMADFLKFADEGILVEKALHESYLGGSGPETEPSPTCMLYTSFESAKAVEPVEVEAAAILPCFWVSQRVGESILQNCRPDNPYARWIATYGDEAFARSTARAVEICDELAATTTGSIRERMTDTFITATRLEWMFWDSAYNMEKWKI